MRREFPVSSAGTSAAFDFIAEAVAQLGRDSAVAHRLSVIVDEICANMIRHDGSLTGADRFTIELGRDDAGTVLVVCDTGRPFNPLEHRQDYASEIGGHGLALIRGLASRVSYERTGDCNRLTVAIAAE